MTKEIALHCMKSASELKKELCEECPIFGQTGSDHCYEDALQYVIAMLEQQPCDCISREALLAKIDEERKHLLALKMDGAEHIVVHHARRIIEDMPPVTPQPKTGRWIEVTDKIDRLGNRSWHYECSICDNGASGWGEYKYCPNCGAKMEVEE